MEKTKYSAFELFVTYGEFFCISELNISDINENFKNMKSNERYSALLDKYNFDETDFSLELEEEINNFVQTDKVLLVKNSSRIFFNMDRNQKEEINENVSGETRKLITKFITDFVGLNMEKNYNNTKVMSSVYQINQKIM